MNSGSKQKKPLLSFYTLAANLYCQVASKRSTITSLALNDNVYQKKKMYALLKQCHKNISIIVQIAEKSLILPIPSNTCKKEHALICILVHDLLWNSELLKNEKKMQDFLATFPIIESCKTRIRAEWVRLSIKGTTYKSSTDENSTSKKIKYARINTLLSSDTISTTSIIDGLKSANQCTISLDDIVPNLVIFRDFSTNFQFHKCQFVKDGRLIVQVGIFACITFPRIRLAVFQHYF